MPSSDPQHGPRAGGIVHLCVGGDGLQPSPGKVPTAGGEQGGGPFIKPAALGLSNGSSIQEFVLLVQSKEPNVNTIVMDNNIELSP